MELPADVADSPTSKDWLASGRGLNLKKSMPLELFSRVIKESAQRRTLPLGARLSYDA